MPMGQMMGGPPPGNQQGGAMKPINDQVRDSSNCLSVRMAMRARAGSGQLRHMIFKTLLVLARDAPAHGRAAGDGRRCVVAKCEKPPRPPCVIFTQGPCWPGMPPPMGGPPGMGGPPMGGPGGGATGGVLAPFGEARSPPSPPPTPAVREIFTILVLARDAAAHGRATGDGRATHGRAGRRCDGRRNLAT
jgi:hypothetical protein